MLTDCMADDGELEVNDAINIVKKCKIEMDKMEKEMLED